MIQAATAYPGFAQETQGYNPFAPRRTPGVHVSRLGTPLEENSDLRPVLLMSLEIRSANTTGGLYHRQDFSAKKLMQEGDVKLLV
jgi:hypothetical protein